MNQLIGNKLKEIRKNKGLSQEKLARIVVLDRTYISRVEAGKINITIDTLYVLCKGLNISLTAFFELLNL